MSDGSSEVSAQPYGLAVEADWRPDFAVTASMPGGPRLAGQVLRADQPRLLSYTLGDTADDASVYITWEVDAQPEGTVVRLYVDEPSSASTNELELSWLRSWPR